jgi:DNA-binding transcriptional LysR family regulator
VSLELPRIQSVAHPVPLGSIAAHPVIMPAGGLGLRALIDQAAARAQVEIDVAVQTNSVNLQKQFVERGHGWTILPSPERSPSRTGRTAPASDHEVIPTLSSQLSF